MQLTTLDLIVFGAYVLGMMAFGIWISNREKNSSTQDYFLASQALPWWAIGGSLIASNISTEQILGMNGSGFELGLAIASYELMAAATLLLVAKFFLPIFLKEGIYTMPQFLEKRYDGRVRSLMAVFWVALFIFVNITSVLYLGGLAIESLMGFTVSIDDAQALGAYLQEGAAIPTGTGLSQEDLQAVVRPDVELLQLYNEGILSRNYNVPLLLGIFGLVIYSASFSIFGGLKAVVWTDVIQVVILVVGGFAAAYAVLAVVGDGNFFTGLRLLFERTPERFEMIFEPTDNYIERLTGEVKSSYNLLPGISVLFGGMWIANIYYWGNNQYIIQRALAATDLRAAQRGVAFAAFLKVFMPLIVVIPGIAAFVLDANIEKADQAFPWVLGNYVTVGLRGLTFAALVAAIGSSISSMVNSASTIFTLDIYKKHLDKDATDTKLVRVGKITAAAALLIGASVGPLLGNLGQVIQFIQEYTGFISPGVVAVFIFGMFWRRTTANAALAVVLFSIPLSTGFKFLFPELPFIDRMAITFLLSCVLLIGISLYETKRSNQAVSDRFTRVGLVVALLVIAAATGLKIILQNIEGVGNLTGWITLILALIAVYFVWTERHSDVPQAIDIDRSSFRTDAVFNLSAAAVVIILVVIYAFLG